MIEEVRASANIIKVRKMSRGCTLSGVEIEDCISIATLRGALPFAKLLLHAGEFLLLLLDLLREENVLILEKLNLGEEFVHLDCVLLAGVLEGGEGDVLAGNEVLHVL